MPKYSFIINTTSNSGRSKPYIEDHIADIEGYFSDYQLIYVDDPEDLITIAEQTAKHSDVVIACGGDGTVQSVVRGIYNSDSLLGVIPLGSGNDFVKSIGIKSKQPISYYLEIIKTQNIIKVDIPAINDEIFINTAGLGFDGLTSYYASQSKWVKGKMKYLVAGLKAFFTAQTYSVKITHDENKLSLDVWLVAIANGAIEGGAYKISPNSSNTDGTLDLVIVPAYNRLKLAIAFIKLSFGKSLGNSFSTVIPFTKGQLEFKNPHRIHLDGEASTAFNRYEIYILPTSLDVIAAF